VTPVRSSAIDGTRSRCASSSKAGAVLPGDHRRPSRQVDDVHVGAPPAGPHRPAPALGLPCASGRTHGVTLLAVACLVAAPAALLVPIRRVARTYRHPLAAADTVGAGTGGLTARMR
jgi:hypothetical protein